VHGCGMPQLFVIQMYVRFGDEKGQRKDYEHHHKSDRDRME
jgi:hypothetical protein